MPATSVRVLDFPPTLGQLIEKFRRRINRVNYMLMWIGAIVLICDLIALLAHWQFKPKAWVASVIGLGCGVVGWYLSLQNRPAKIVDVLEDELHTYGDPAHILQEIENELQHPFIIGPDGAITEHWVISSNYSQGYLIWPIEPIDIVHYVTPSSYGRARMELWFASGKYVTLAESMKNTRDAYGRLTERFGPIQITPAAARVIDIHGRLSHLVFGDDREESTNTKEALLGNIALGVAGLIILYLIYELTQ